MATAALEICRRNARGKENLLGQFLYLGTRRRLVPAILVGAGRNHSHRHCELVDSVPQRLVLVNCRARSGRATLKGEGANILPGWLCPGV